MELLNNKSNQDLMNIDECATFIRMSKKFIQKHRQAGRFPGVVLMGDQKYFYNRGVIQKRLDDGILLLAK